MVAFLVGIVVVFVSRGREDGVETRRFVLAGGLDVILRTSYEGRRERSDLRRRAGGRGLGVRVVGGVSRPVAFLSKAGRIHTDTEE